MAMDSSKIMNGTYGSVYDANGNWLTNVKSFEAKVEISKEEIKRAGTRWVGHKVTGLKGTGSMTGYKITTSLIESIGQVADDTKGAFVTELQGKIADPENGGTVRVRLKNVTFDNIDLMKYEVGSIIEQETNFTFSEYVLLDTIAE